MGFQVKFGLPYHFKTRRCCEPDSDCASFGPLGVRSPRWGQAEVIFNLKVLTLKSFMGLPFSVIDLNKIRHKALFDAKDCI